MLGPANDMILHRFIKEIEFLAEAGNADRQVTVPVGMVLGINQGICVHYIELDVAKPPLCAGKQYIGEIRDIPVGE